MLSFDPKCTAKGMKSMDVSGEVKRLAEIFRDYNFDVTTEVITPDCEAQTQAYVHLAKFRMEQIQKKNALSIVYYAGHGWRSLNKQRKKKGGFDLAPSKVEAELMQPKGVFIQWEEAEKLLLHMPGDVLVIFDCCDSGYLDGRGSAHAFDYLVACAENKWTHEPGEKSFISALIWALKELKSDIGPELTVNSKRKKPFKIQQLRDKIKEHEHFPEKQQPLLFPRFGDVTEPIWLAPIEKAITPSTPETISTGRRRSSGTKSDSHPEECSYVDLRFFFKEEITCSDAEKVARMVSSTVQNQSLELNANHVSALKFGSAVAARKTFRRVFHSILAANSFSKLSPQADDEEQEEFGSPARKRAKIGPLRKENRAHHGLEPLRVSKRPVTPVSDETQSDEEAHVTVHVESGATASVDVHLTKSNAVASDAVGIHIVPKSD